MTVTMMVFIKVFLRVIVMMKRRTVSKFLLQVRQSVQPLTDQGGLRPKISSPYKIFSSSSLSYRWGWWCSLAIIIQWYIKNALEVVSLMLQRIGGGRRGRCVCMNVVLDSCSRSPNARDGNLYIRTNGSTPITTRPNLTHGRPCIRYYLKDMWERGGGV